jgi:hypothetical protein
MGDFWEFIVWLFVVISMKNVHKLIGRSFFGFISLNISCFKKLLLLVWSLS